MSIHPFGNHRLDSFAKQVAECRSLLELRILTREIAAHFSVPYFFQNAIDLSNDSLSIRSQGFSNIKSDDISPLFEMNAFSTNIHLKRLRSSALPFEIEASLFSSDAVTSIHGDDSGDPLQRLIFVPSLSYRGEKLFFLFGGRSQIISFEKSALLNMVCTCIADRLIHLSKEAERNKYRLTEFERECLLWTSEGKTSFEISVILKMSKFTVDSYLSNVSKRLSASNKVHAVSIAIRENLI